MRGYGGRGWESLGSQVSFGQLHVRGEVLIGMVAWVTPASSIFASMQYTTSPTRKHMHSILPSNCL